jgi:O-antigen ligase
LVPAQIRQYRPTTVFCAGAFALLCCLLLGGSTVLDAILELLAIPALLLALISLVELPVWRTKTRTDAYWVLAFCFAIALLPLVQLVPLPPSIWTVLPGRNELVKIFDLIGGPTPWMPISVSPRATWLSFLSLLPPMAIFLLVIQMNHHERRTLILFIIAFGVVSAFLGLMQVAGGENSPLRFYAVAYSTDAVGFFANRNHFAALLYTVLLFVAVWAIDVGFETESWTNIRSFDAARIMAATATFLSLVVVIAGEAMTRSRAGLALTIAALLAAFVLALTDQRNVSGAKPSKLLLAAIFLAVILIVQFALYRILERFAADPLGGARQVFAHNTIVAAKSFFPFGSGLGTFVPVYAMFEKPIDTIANNYVNHAHDDILELFLETGIMGALLLCLFVIWFGFSSFKLWRRSLADTSAFDCTLGRAATVVIGLLLAHSFVDYPMRNVAITAVFAVSCALLIEPLGLAGPAMRGALAPTRKKARRKPELSRSTPNLPEQKLPVAAASVVPARGTVASNTPQAGGRWGEGIEWPDEWRASGGAKSSGSTSAESEPHGASEPGKDDPNSEPTS